MMSLTVPVGTLSLLPSPFLSPPASLYLSISVVTVRKPGSGRKEESQGRKKQKEEEEDEEAEQLYTNQDYPEYFHSILPLTAAGTLYLLGIFDIAFHALVLTVIQ